MGIETNLLNLAGTGIVAGVALEAVDKVNTKKLKIKTVGKIR